MGFDHHRLHPLKSVNTHLLPPLVLEEAKITVAAHVLDGEESKKAFGHDIPSRGIYPLQLSIQNNTSESYSLCASSVDLPRVAPSKVAWKISKSALPRAIAYKIASFFFWPLMIPSTIDGIRVMSHHNKIKRDMNAKAMKDEVIAPYSTLNRVLFVKKSEFKPSFKVTLIDIEDLHSTDFQVETQT